MKGSSTMKTATSLTLVAAGAIIAFAITAHVAFLNLQVTGWVFILTGVAGAIIPRSGWLRRILAAKGRPGAPCPPLSPRRPPMPRRPSTRPSRNTPAPDHAPGPAVPDTGELED